MGAFLVLLSVVGAVPAAPARGARRRSRPGVAVRAAGAVLCALPVYGATGWLVMAVVAGFGGWMAPELVARRRRTSHRADRVDAVASWAEMVRDLLAASGGLQQAIAASAAVAPPAIRDDVASLAARARLGLLAEALRRFADDVDSPVADVLVASLLLAAEQQAANLGAALTAAARAARSQVAMRQQVEAGRSRTYTARRVVVGVTLGFTGSLLVLNRSYLEPFASPAGQVALLVIAACLGGGLWAIGRMGRFEEPARLFGSSE
ncbi:MAG TPA: type II secretion system F family protein [Acidimicrobiales bacterium]